MRLRLAALVACSLMAWAIVVVAPGPRTRAFVAAVILAMYLVEWWRERKQIAELERALMAGIAKAPTRRARFYAAMPIPRGALITVTEDPQLGLVVSAAVQGPPVPVKVGTVATVGDDGTMEVDLGDLFPKGKN